MYSDMFGVLFAIVLDFDNQSSPSSNKPGGKIISTTIKDRFDSNITNFINYSSLSLIIIIKA